MHRLSWTLRGLTPAHTALISLISDCRLLASSFQGFQARHILREANGVPDKLAKDVRRLPTFVSLNSVILINDPPSELLQVLFADASGVSYPGSVYTASLDANFGKCLLIK